MLDRERKPVPPFASGHPYIEPQRHHRADWQFTGRDGADPPACFPGGQGRRVSSAASCITGNSCAKVLWASHGADAANLTLMTDTRQAAPQIRKKPLLQEDAFIGRAYSGGAGAGRQSSGF